MAGPTTTVLHIGPESNGALLTPEEFDAACRRHAPKAIYLTPTFQNPTGSVMPVGRREEIAEVARRHRVAVVEDDIYAFFDEDGLPTVTSMVGDLGYFLSSLSKSVAPGRSNNRSIARTSSSRVACLRVVARLRCALT